jgi:hypothetical protein
MEYLLELLFSNFVLKSATWQSLDMLAIFVGVILCSSNTSFKKAFSSSRKIFAGFFLLVSQTVQSFKDLVSDLCVLKWRQFTSWLSMHLSKDLKQKIKGFSKWGHKMQLSENRNSSKQKDECVVSVNIYYILFEILFFLTRVGRTVDPSL